jgi:dienelactone hydrolase
VVIGHGSGQVTKTDGIAYVPFLLARGFAVLRYDKRGVGQSTGTYRGVSAVNSVAQVAELGGDMAAGVAFLARRPDIDGERIGLMGTSQAGWVMVSALEQGARVRFTIAVTGSVVPVGLNIHYEDRAGQPIDTAYAALDGYAGPLGYDPAPGLRATGVPTLWLLGSADRLVPTRVCERVLFDLAAGEALVRWVVYPGAEHGLFGTSYWPDIDRFLAEAGLRR